MEKITLVVEYDGEPMTFARVCIAVWDVLRETGGKALLIKKGDLTAAPFALAATPNAVAEHDVHEVNEILSTTEPATTATEAEVAEQESTCPFCLKSAHTGPCGVVSLTMDTYASEETPSIEVKTELVQGRYCPGCKHFIETAKFPLGSTEGETCPYCLYNMHSTVIMERVPV